MSIKHLAIVCVMLIVLTLLVPMNASAAVNGIETGDFWEYRGDLTRDIGATGNVTVKMAVVKSLNEVVAGRSQAVFRLNLSGGGDVRVLLPGFGNSTGTVQIRGSLDRLESNFSVARSSTILAFELKIVQGGVQLTVPVTFGLIARLSQALDDYIGDNSLAVGTEVTSRTNATVNSWSNSVLFGNITNDLTENEQIMMQVTRANVSVTVPAGTFDCWEVKVTGTSGSNSTPTGFWYYSQKVGNYVQMKNANASPMSFLGNLNLTGYSYKKSGAFSLSSPIGLAIMGGIIVVIAIVVILAALSSARKKRRSGPLAPEGGKPPPQVRGQPPMPPEPPAPPPGGVISVIVLSQSPKGSCPPE